MSYGGGYSTDVGLSAFLDIRQSNFRGNLWQFGSRLQFSQRQQLVQFDFVDPRFMHDGPKRFSPLTLSLMFQRDTTVTRFFRSAFDKGTFGIVQRLDAKGNPIDTFGQKVSSPTIDRIGFTAETSRTISRASRSIIFFRARFEDVRLAHVESLLIKDLLVPDKRRRSPDSQPRLSATRERTPRQNSPCSTLSRKGDPVDPCHYNATDPTNGQYVTSTTRSA